jgi:hypothetical protein
MTKLAKYIIIAPLILLKSILPLYTDSTEINNYYIPINQLNFYSLEEYLETIAGEDPNNTIDDLLDIIDYYMDNPINLRIASVNFIAELPGFSYFDAYTIADIVKRNNNISLSALCKLLNLNEYQE